MTEQYHGGETRGRQLQGITTVIVLNNGFP